MGVIRWVGASYNGVVSIDYQRKMAGCLPFSPTALTLLPADNGPLLMRRVNRCRSLSPLLLIVVLLAVRLGAVSYREGA